MYWMIRQVRAIHGPLDVRFIALLWTLLLMSVSLTGRHIANFLREHHFLGFALLSLSAFVAVVIAKEASRRAQVPLNHLSQDLVKTGLIYLFMTGVAVIFWVESIEEVLHLIEYPILYGLYLRVWKHPYRAWIVAAVVAFIVEGIQVFVPDRYFDWKDVWMNQYGVAVGFLVCRYWRENVIAARRTS